ncbi:hypothetical protein LSPH24S_09106 [Lysinibacillus sphaericus]
MVALQQIYLSSCPHFAQWFNTIDSFDTHAKIPEFFDAVDAAAQKCWFFEDYVATHLSQDEILKVSVISEGWAISITLLAEQWNYEALDYWLTIHSNDLFTYLSEEVFFKMPKFEQKTLLQLAILPTFSEALNRCFRRVKPRAFKHCS